MNVGKAMASEGPMRVVISLAMSRPSSARPKSPTNMRADLVYRTVSVSTPIPFACELMNSGLS